MNQIVFDIQQREYGKIVIPVIDGKSLISILREIELPFARKEGCPEIAGAYDGISISCDFFSSGYYSGENKIQQSDAKTPLLLCDCSCAGCWDFVAKIVKTNKKIIWKNFEQVHRENWNYDELGILEFDKEQFENAAKELENK